MGVSRASVTNVSTLHAPGRLRVWEDRPSELLFRWMENMRMHFDVVCDKSAAVLKNWGSWSAVASEGRMPESTHAQSHLVLNEALGPRRPCR